MKIRLLFLLVLSGSLLLAEESRTWNTITGGHFTAKIVGVQATTVTLANGDGKAIDFPLADLKPSDRDYVRNWQQAQLASTNAGSGGEGSNVELTSFGKKVFRDLVHVKGSRLASYKPELTEAPKYYAFYFSAKWCPPCRKFTPDLVDFYDRYKGKGAPFELVFVSSDRGDDAMQEYMEEYDMNWPAFENGENRDIVSRNGGGIPNLVVTDADGKKLLDSYNDSGKYLGPRSVMKKLEKLLKE